MPALSRSFQSVSLKVFSRASVVGVLSAGLEVGCRHSDFIDAQTGAGADPVLWEAGKNQQAGKK